MQNFKVILLYIRSSTKWLPWKKRFNCFTFDGTNQWTTRGRDVLIW